MLVVTTEHIPGKQYEVLGTAFGVTTQSRTVCYPYRKQGGQQKNNLLPHYNFLSFFYFIPKQNAAKI